MVYVDRLRRFGFRSMGQQRESCHLTADSYDELLKFADVIKAPRAWLHSGSKPHFDLTKRWREVAVKNGAREI